MSLRDLDRVVRAFETRQKNDLHRHYLVAAVGVSEIVNIIGAAHSTKEHPWTFMAPAEFFDSWTGTSSKPVIDQDYVEAVMEAIKEREASTMFMGQTD